MLSSVVHEVRNLQIVVRRLGLKTRATRDPELLYHLFHRRAMNCLVAVGADVISILTVDGPGMQVCKKEGQDSLVFSALLKHIRKQKEGSPQQTMLLQEAARQASGLPASFAVPALISALQVSASETIGSVAVLQQCVFPTECYSCFLITAG